MSQEPEYLGANLLLFLLLVSCILNGGTLWIGSGLFAAEKDGLKDALELAPMCFVLKPFIKRGALWAQCQRRKLSLSVHAVFALLPPWQIQLPVLGLKTRLR